MTQGERIIAAFAVCPGTVLDLLRRTGPEAFESVEDFECFSQQAYGRAFYLARDGELVRELRLSPDARGTMRHQWHYSVPESRVACPVVQARPSKLKAEVERLQGEVALLVKERDELLALLETATAPAVSAPALTLVAL